MFIISKTKSIKDPDLLIAELFKVPVIPLNDAKSGIVKTTNTVAIVQQETVIFPSSSQFKFVATSSLASCVFIIFTLPDGNTLATHYDGAEGYDWNRHLSGYRDCEISLKLIGGLGSKGLDNIKKVLRALQNLSQTDNRTFKITNQRLHDFFYLEPSSAIYEMNNYLFKKLGEAFEYYLRRELPKDCSGLAFPATFQESKLDIYEKLKKATKDIPYAQVATAIETALPETQEPMGLLQLLLEAQPRKVSEIDPEIPIDTTLTKLMQNPGMLDAMIQVLFGDPIAYQIARIFFKYVETAAEEEKSYYNEVALSLETGEFCVLPHHQCSIGPNRLVRLLQTIALTFENNFVYYKDRIPENFQISETMRKMLFKFIPHFKLNNSYIPKAVSDAIVEDFKVSHGSVKFMFILSVFAEVSRDEKFKEFRQQPVANPQTVSSSSSSSSTSTSSSTSSSGLRGGFFVTPTAFAPAVSQLKPNEAEQKKVAASESSTKGNFGGLSSGFLGGK